MEETISDRLAKLERGLVDLEEPAPRKKQFKMPIGARISKGRVMKKEWVHVMMIRSNGNIQIKTCKIEEDTVKFGEYFYDARAGNVLRWKGRPILILKEWNISPETNPDINTETHKLDINKDYEEASKNGNLTAAQKLILTKMKMEVIKPKMAMNMGTVLIILAVLGGGYFLLGSIGVI